MSTVGILLFQSIGAGYAALNDAGAADELEILEFSPLGAQAQLIIQGEISLVSKLIAQIKNTELLTSAMLENLNEKILKSYLNLEIHPILEEVIIIETDFVGTLFNYANLYLEKNKNINIVDLRVFRTTNSACYLIMTGKDLEILPMIEQEAASTVKIKIIKNISKGFHSYLDLGPR